MGRRYKRFRLEFSIPLIGPLLRSNSNEQVLLLQWANTSIQCHQSIPLVYLISDSYYKSKFSGVTYRFIHEKAAWNSTAIPLKWLCMSVKPTTLGMCRVWPQQGVRNKTSYSYKQQACPDFIDIHTILKTTLFTTYQFCFFPLHISLFVKYDAQFYFL